MRRITLTLFAAMTAWLCLAKTHHGTGARAGLPGDNAGRESRRLPDGIIARMGTTQLRHAGYLRGVIFSPDGQSLASWGSDGFIRVWDASSGRQRHKLFADEDGVSALAFSADSKRLTAACGKARVRVWDVGANPPVVTMDRRLELWEKCALSADGKLLAFNDEEGWIAVWDIAAADGLRRLRRAEPGERVITVSPDNRAVVSAIASQHGLRVWETATGKDLASFQGANGARLFAAAFAPDGRTLASAGHGMAYLWDLSGAKTHKTLPTHDKMVWTLAFSPDGGTLACGDSSAGASADGTVTLWNTGAGRVVRELRGHTGGVECLAFSPDGKTIASGGWDHAVRLWESTTGREIFPCDGHHGAVRCAALSPDGKLLASGGWDAVVRLWNPRTGRELRRLSGHGDPVLSVAFAPNGKTLVSTSADGTLRRWDLASGEETKDARMTGHALAYAPNGSRVAWASGPVGIATIHVFDAASRVEICKLDGHAHGVDALVFSPDGGLLVSMSGNDPLIRLWDVPTGRLVKQFTGYPGGTSSAAFSADARALVLRTAKNCVQVWETDTGHPLAEVHAGAGETIEAVMFCQRDRVLALAIGGRGQENRIRLWDTATASELRVLTGHEGAINALCADRDGVMLVSASSDTSLISWDLHAVARPAMPPQAPLGAAEVAQLWADLGGNDAARAFRARWKFVGVPKQAVRFLAERLEPRCTDPQEGAAEFIRDLDSDDFTTRDTAARELERLANAAHLELIRALQRPPSLEFRRRVEQLLARLKPGPVPALEGDLLRRIRALAVLEHLASEDSVALLKTLAARPNPGREAREAQAALSRLGAHRPAAGR
jgi:WD40 repeat protein